MAGCPARPNCVSSLAEGPQHAVEPIALGGDARDAWRQLRAIIDGLPRTTITVDEPSYLAAECTSHFFGFVDDLEFKLDSEAGLIQVRSASRVGYSDLGVNRRRVEQIRRMFESR